MSSTLSNIEKEQRIIRIIEEANGEKPSKYLVRMLVDIEDEIHDLKGEFEQRFDFLEQALNLRSDKSVNNWIRRNQTKAMAGSAGGFGALTAGIIEALRMLL